MMARESANAGAGKRAAADKGGAIELPTPDREGKMALEAALNQRRSVRAYQDTAVSLKALGQILWAAQGVTNERGFRTAPSAGALYPLEIYVAAGNVSDLAAGIYRYDVASHSLRETAKGDARGALRAAALGQASVGAAAAVIVIAAVYERTTGKYGERGIRYTHMEVGNVTQNIHLQAETLGLGTVVIGAFEDDKVSEAAKLPSQQKPLALMPIGKK